MHSHTSVTLAQRASRAVLAVALIAVGGAAATFAPLAQAQTGKAFSGAAEICSFSGFTYDAATGTLNIACSTPPAPLPPPPVDQPGTFSLSPTVSTVAPGGNTTVTIVRSGGTTGSYSVGYTMAPTGLTGWSVNNWAGPHAAVWFDEGQTAVTLNVAAGSTAGSLTLELVGTLPNAPTTATTTASGSSTVTVSATQSETPPPGCLTTASKMDSFDRVTARIFLLKPGETAAMSFRTYSGALAPAGAIKLSTIETVNTPSDADHEIRIAACPGDFNSACGGYVNYKGGSINVAVNDSSTACKLDVSRTYYMNVRQVKPRSTEPSCTRINGCEIDLGIQNYKP